MQICIFRYIIIFLEIHLIFMILLGGKQILSSHWNIYIHSWETVWDDKTVYGASISALQYHMTQLWHNTTQHWHSTIKYPSSHYICTALTKKWHFKGNQILKGPCDQSPFLIHTATYTLVKSAKWCTPSPWQCHCHMMDLTRTKVTYRGRDLYTSLFSAFCYSGKSIEEPSNWQTLWQIRRWLICSENCRSYQFMLVF